MAKVALSNKIVRYFESLPRDFHLVILFGSHATGRANAASDIDVAVAADRPLSYERRVALQTGLSLTLKREVDLADLHRADGVLLSEILTTGRVIVKKDPGLYARFLKKMWYDQSDYQPLRRRILAAGRRRFVGARGRSRKKA